MSQVQSHTTEQELIKFMINSGMSEDQAKEVMVDVKVQFKEEYDYDITWDRPASEYPTAIRMILPEAIKPIALRWIMKNKPQAWFKNMFV